MKRHPTAWILVAGLSAAAVACIAPDAAAQLAPPVSPAGVHISVDGDPVGLAGGIKIMLMMVALALAPSIVLSMTSFTRIIVVLALLRQAVGVSQLPPSRVLVGLALFLTLFTMAPVIRAIDTNAYTPYQEGRLDDRQALIEAGKPLRDFMLRHTRESDLGLFLHVMGAARPATVDDVPIVAVVPAFMLSELKTAFQIGALLFIPFLVIDIVVASVLMSMGMMMLPPATMSLPLKLIVFVVVDGWGLVVTSLANGFRG